MTDADDIQEFTEWLDEQGYTVKHIESDSEGRTSPVPGTRYTHTVTFTKFEKVEFPDLRGDDDD